MSDPCSAVRLARQNRRRRSAHRPAAGSEGCSAPDGASQSGKIVKVFPHGSTDSAPHPDAFVLVIVALTESPSVADDRVVLANGTSPRQAGPAESPRIDVVFRLWQCDKKNHGWREGPPLTVPAKVSI